MLGIAVRDGRTFEPVGYGRAFGRWLLTLLLWALFAIPGILDTLSPLGNDRRQAWHDRAVGAVVVHV